MLERVSRRALLLGALGVSLLFGILVHLKRLFVRTSARETSTTKGGDAMTRPRSVKRIISSRATVEGAGVHLRRLFGFGEEEAFDPFLLMDHFGSDRPEHYVAGFPWHPHRGIETITYVLEGTVAHMDSLGNKGTIGVGDIQWMTAGSGIVHQEMPKGDSSGRMSGFQLWTNLPMAEKMSPPKYRDITADDIPEIVTEDGIRVKIIAGTFSGIHGRVDDIAIQPEYLDVTIPEHQTFTHATPAGHTVFAYVFKGAAAIESDEATTRVEKGHIALFSDGDEIRVVADAGGTALVLISGNPLNEPIAWRGPIVMNTEEELRIAFEEYRNGTFIKSDQSRGSN